MRGCNVISMLGLIWLLSVGLLIAGLVTFGYTANHFREGSKAKNGFFVSGFLFIVPTAFTLGYFIVSDTPNFVSAFISPLAVIVFEVILVVIMLIACLSPSKGRAPRNVIKGIAIFAVLQLVVVILLLTLTLSLAGGDIHEEYNYEERYEDYGYTEEDGEITIDVYLGSEKEIEVPSVIDGKPVTKFGSYAFDNCYELTSITIPESVTTIEENTFHDCIKLYEITISPDNPTYVSSEGMIYSKDMQTLVVCAEGRIGKIQIPDTVQQIGDNAFSRCTSLTQIIIPDNVTKIGECAFYGCTSLTNINIPASVIVIGPEAFSDCTNLRDISISSDNPEFAAEAGILYNKKMTAVICCMSGISGSVTVPDGVKTIGAHAFDGCDRITSLTLPEGVTEIGTYAFDCVWDLSMITIPETVTSIGKYAIPSYKIVIYCNEGSYAQTYAVENEISYVLMK